MFKSSSIARLSALVMPLVILSVAGCRHSKTANGNSKSMTNSSEISTASDPISIHQRAIIIDMHADTAQRLVDEQVDLAQLLPDGHFDAVRAKEGGLDAQFFSI